MAAKEHKEAENSPSLSRGIIIMRKIKIKGRTQFWVEI